MQSLTLSPHVPVSTQVRRCMFCVLRNLAGASQKGRYYRGHAAQEKPHVCARQLVAHARDAGRAESGRVRNPVARNATVSVGRVSPLGACACLFSASLTVSRMLKLYFEFVRCFQENMISVVADELSKCNDLLQLISHYENSSTNDSLTLLTTLSLYLMPAQLLCALFSVYPTPGSSFVLVTVLASLVFMFAFVRYRSHQQNKPLLINQQHRQLLGGRHRRSGSRPVFGQVERLEIEVMHNPPIFA